MSLSLHDQVRLALAGDPGDSALALGWVAAGAVVAARFADAAIDAVPIYTPGRGLTEFLLTRRLSGAAFASEAADSVGRIVVSGEGAPSWGYGADVARLALGPGLRADPDGAVASLMARVPKPPLPAAAQDAIWAARRRLYPALFAATVSLILRTPGLAAARELFVSDQPHDGAYHPLYLHGVARAPGMVYDWLLLQGDERAVFAHTATGQVIYDTGRGSWAIATEPLDAGDPESMAGRLAGWLGR